MRKLILPNQQSPGDIVILTAAVRDLKRVLGAAVAVDVRKPRPLLRSLTSERDSARRAAWKLAGGGAQRHHRNPVKTGMRPGRGAG